jgi:tripartite-type tricarboxylate transporter receptor subunit TctC
VARIAVAQSYPSRPIKLVIPFPPGGVNDAIGRPWADRMKTLLGTVVIENIGGAGGSLGVAGVARAQPDGYTLVLANTSNMVVAPVAATRPLYDPIRDFEPIYHLGSGAGVFAVHPSLPTPTLNALVDHAKSNRNKLSYGSPGVGTTNHLAGEMFKLLTETPDIVHIPYRGAGPLLSDLIGGQILFASMVMTGQVLDFHRSGQAARARCHRSGPCSRRTRLSDRDRGGICRPHHAKSVRTVCTEGNTAPNRGASSQGDAHLHGGPGLAEALCRVRIRTRS